MAAKGGNGLPGRAARFAARLRGEHVASFAELANPPMWSAVDDVQHNDLVVVVGLLSARPAIDSELNGARLAALAQFVGEKRFDRVCEADLSEISAEDQAKTLPTPVEVIERGEQIIGKADRIPAYAQMAELAADILAQTAEMEAAE